MNKTNLFPRTARAGFLLNASLLALLTGCAAHVYVAPPAVYVDPAPIQGSVVVQDNYVYYPGYDTYYNPYRHQYAYMDGGAWVTRSAPRGVSVDVFLASPSVRMNFHDSPALHHAEISRKYPRNWKPNRSEKAKPRDDKREENNGK